MSFAQQTANQYENRSALALCTWIVREKPVVALFGPAGVGLGACPARSLEDTRELTDLTKSEGKEQQKGERERERAASVAASFLRSGSGLGSGRRAL